MLAFTIYYLLQNPEALRKAQQEIDSVVRRGPVSFQHLNKLPYIEAILRESLRLSPTAPGFSVTPLATEPVVLGGKYVIPPDASLLILLTRSGLDPAVFGEDAHEFKPERLLEKNFRDLRSGAWKPFGNGE